jgi:hypothetical protein
MELARAVATPEPAITTVALAAAMSLRECTAPDFDTPGTA